MQVRRGYNKVTMANQMQTSETPLAFNMELKIPKLKMEGNKEKQVNYKVIRHLE